MQIVMTTTDGVTDYTERLHATRRVWSGMLAYPVAPKPDPDQPPGSIEDSIGPFASQLGPDGDFAEDRGDFDMDEVIMHATSAELLLDYPLEHPAHLAITDLPDGALTPRLIVTLAADAYREIYRIEDQGEDTPASQRIAGGAVLMNRPATSGMFGIWGHVIHDLFVERIDVGDAGDGHAMLRISMGS